MSLQRFPQEVKCIVQVLNVFKYPIINNQTRSPFGLRVNSPRGEAEWAIDPWPLRAKGLIVLVSPIQSNSKGNNKVSKCKLKKYLFGGKTKEKPAKFRYSMTITIRPLVAQPIKMQYLHQSTSWVILIYISINLPQSHCIKRKKCQVTRRKELFYHVTSGSNVTRAVQ